jgi:hypothetical protein
MKCRTSQTNKTNAAEPEKLTYFLQFSVQTKGATSGAVILPGDRLAIPSEGMIGGSVQGLATNDACGAWFSRGISNGSLIYEARKPGVIKGELGGFVGTAMTATIPGEISYSISGRWIGGTGKLIGPIISKPTLNVVRAGSSVVLTWPTNFTGWFLESNFNIQNSNNWTIISLAPSTKDANFFITNTTSAERRYFRLRK